MSGAVRVNLQLTPATSDGADWSALAKSASMSAAKLVHALGLPVEPVVALAEAPARPPSDGPPYALQIGDRPGRLARTFPAAGGPDGLAVRLQHDLVRNADLFVTDAVADAVRAQWASRAPRPLAADLPPLELGQLLRECVHFGSRVDRLADAEPGADGRDPLWWRLLEGALEVTPSVGVVVPAALLADNPPGLLAETVRDYVHGLTGVILPPMELLSADQGGAGNLLVRVRDTTVIVPTGDDAGSPLERIATALRPWLPAFVTGETVKAKLQAAATELPRLVSAVRARFGDPFLTRTFRALVGEDVAINDLRTILDGVLEIREATGADEENRIVFHAPAGTPPPALALTDGRLDPEDAADCVRRWTRRLTTAHRWGETLQVRLLTPALESAIRGGSVEPGSPEHRRFLEALDGSAEPILTNVDIRRRVFDRLTRERPDIAVLCYPELLPETSIVQTERIDL